MLEYHQQFLVVVLFVYPLESAFILLPLFAIRGYSQSYSWPSLFEKKNYQHIFIAM